MAAPDCGSLIPGMSLSREDERPGRWTRALSQGPSPHQERLAEGLTVLKALSEGREKTASSLEHPCLSFVFRPSGSFPA